jgi:hypothetical protein
LPELEKSSYQTMAQNYLLNSILQHQLLKIHKQQSVFLCIRTISLRFPYHSMAQIKSNVAAETTLLDLMTSVYTPSVLGGRIFLIGISTDTM